MKKFLRTLAVAASALVLALSLCACGGGDGNEIESRVDQYGNKIVTVLFHKASGTPEATAYAKLVQEYMETHEGVIIEPEYVTQTTGVNQYETTLTTKFDAGGGELYDIITYDSPICSGYAKSGMLYDSTELLGDYVNEFLPSSVPMYNGKVYGLPIQEASAGFFCNLKLLKQAGISAKKIEQYKKGWTYDEFYDVCSKLKSKGVRYPVDFQLSSNDEELRTFFLYPFGYSDGGEYCSEDGKTVKGYMDGEQVASGLEIISECIKQGYTSKDIKSTEFHNGKIVGMYLSSGWTIPSLKGEYKANFSGGYGEGWDILPYPYKTKSEAASATGSWCFGITNNGVRDKSAAVDFLKFLTSKTAAKTISETTGMISARKDATYSDGTPEKFLYDQFSSTGKKRPIMPGYNFFSKQFNLALNDIASGDKGDILSIMQAKTQSLQSELDLDNR